MKQFFFYCVSISHIFLFHIFPLYLTFVMQLYLCSSHIKLIWFNIELMNSHYWSGDYRHQETLTSCHLALKTKKQYSISSDLSGRDVGPELLIVPRGIHRDGGHNVGSIQHVRRLVPRTLNPRCQISNPNDLSTRTKEGKKRNYICMNIINISNPEWKKYR